MTETQAPTIIRAVKEYIAFKVVDLREYSFNEYIQHRAEIGEPINGEREGFYDSLTEEAFHDYLPAYTHRHRYTLCCWDMWWDRFLEMLYARDERETQRTALDVDLCDHFDDWDDERHDPHLDAFV